MPFQTFLSSLSNISVEISSSLFLTRIFLICAFNSWDIIGHNPSLQVIVLNAPSIASSFSSLILSKFPPLLLIISNCMLCLNEPISANAASCSSGELNVSANFERAFMPASFLQSAPAWLWTSLLVDYGIIYKVILESIHLFYGVSAC